MKKILLVLLINLPVVLIGQEAIVEKLLKQGDSLLFVKQHDEARILYEKAKENSKQNQYEYFQNLATYKIGYSYLREDSEFLAMAYFTEIQLALSPLTAQDSALLTLVSLEIDVISYNSVKSGFNPSSIEKMAKELLPNLARDEQSRLQYLLAVVFVQRLEHKKAIELFKDILNGVISDPWIYELSIYGIANEYGNLLEYQQALEFYEALEGRGVVYIEESELLGEIWYNYYQLKSYDLALFYLKKTIDTYSNKKNLNNIINNYLHQGNCCYFLGYNQEAIALFGLAEKLALEKDLTEILIKVYFTKSYFYRRIGDYPMSELYADKSCLYSTTLNENSNLKLSVYNQAIRIYLKQNKYQKALSLVNDFQTSDSVDKVSDNESYLFTLKRRLFFLATGLLYREMWEQDTVQIHYLEQAYEIFRKVLKLSQNIYSNLENEKTKLQVVSSLRIDYENLFLTTYNLYLLTKDSKYLHDLFQLQQQGKATLFKSIIQESEALYNASIPNNLLKREVDLRKHIERLEFYMNPTTSNNIIKDIQENLHEELILAKLRYDSLMGYLEEVYPNYQQHKYGIEEYGIKDIQEVLEEGQLVIDYFITEGRLFKTIISKSEHRILESYFEGELQEDLIVYRRLLQNKKLNDKKKIEVLAHKLYRILLLDIECFIKGKRLFIVPDKELNLIPFETLIVENVDSLSNLGFNSLPYLLKTNPISILYSQSQLIDKSRKISKNSKVIGFAPEYLCIQNKNLVALEGAGEEVERISNFYRGDIYIGRSATKGRFVKEAQKFNIIHLALHTIINEKNPKHSQLVFSYNEKPEDIHLTSYEVYGMRFNASLLVLSGCNTGSGELKNGEGVMHLARDFFFAGIRNIVLTQWAVADKSSATIMEYFYKYLYEGNPVDVALQKAKIDFLQYEDPVKHHPFYWAGYIPAGKPAEYKASFPWQWFIFILFTISLIYAMRRMRN